MRVALERMSLLAYKAPRERRAEPFASNHRSVSAKGGAWRGCGAQPYCSYRDAFIDGRVWRACHERGQHGYDAACVRRSRAGLSWTADGSLRPEKRHDALVMRYRLRLGPAGGARNVACNPDCARAGFGCH